MNCEKETLKKLDEPTQTLPLARNLPSHFLDSDDDDQYFDDKDNYEIAVSSESESFVSTSDELIKSSSDSDSDILNDLSFTSLLPTKTNNHLKGLNECKIIECASSYSEDNECDAVDTNIPEPDPSFEFTEMEKEHSHSSESEEFDETES